MSQHRVSRRGRSVLGVGVALTLLGLALPLSVAQPGAAAPSAVASHRPRAPHHHTVTWDKYSTVIDGKRTFLWSGEVHPFRVPSPSLWRDILQKMKSNGYNSVSIYVDWGYESPKQGVYDWTGVRNLDRFLDIAQEVGLYVIARPGPYINAETDGGGYPGWLKTTPGRARTDDATYLELASEYQAQVDRILSRHQLTDGRGTVVLYQIENEYAANINSSPDTETSGSRYLARLYANARNDGITVPIFHNDKGRNGNWRPGDFPTPATEAPANYLYGFDGYPAGICSTSGNPGTPGPPPDWGYYGTGGRKGGASASPNTPGLLAEFGGGWFDPWGDRLWNGAGYECMRTRQSASMERQYYLTNVANGIKIHNVYMTYGGTSWGWLPAPLVYTSYDYGAAFDEGRQQTSKVPAMKEMGYFLQSVPSINKIDQAEAVTASNPAVKSYHLSNPDDGTHFYFFRSDSPSADYSFTFPVNTSDGSYTVPQGGAARLQGVDMLVLLADYDLDSQHLVYSTSELMTHAANEDGSDLALFHTRDGQDGETVLRYASEPIVSTLSGTPPQVTWDAGKGDLRLNYIGDGLTQVRISGGGTARPLTLLLASESVAKTFWRLDTDRGPVIARGPELLRTAKVTRGSVDLTGDTKAAAPLEVWSPNADRRVTWNGKPVATVPTPSGSRLASADLAGAPTVVLPALVHWKTHAETPESLPDFDDSTWAAATNTATNSTTPIPAGQPDLFADDYGFHYGDVWYRGTYDGAADATDVQLSYQTGQVGTLLVWLDGTFLGTHQMPIPTSSQSTTQTWSGSPSFAIPPSLRDGGKHKLAVLVRPMGSEEDGGANDAFKSARGLTSATLTGSAAPIAWRIQGNQGGEDITDTVRGPMNNGGLYGERAGWSLPGYPDRGWTDTTLPARTDDAGVRWYRTTFDLDVPKDLDASLGLTIADDPTHQYRAQLFVNGWNMGQYANDVGPQHTFVLPNGILNPHGHNTLAIADIGRQQGGGATGGGLGTVSLTNLGTVRGGAGLDLVRSPSYDAPRLRRMPLPPHHDADAATVATVTVPADAQGTQFIATIDWGDHTSSDGIVTGTGTHRSVVGSHDYTGKHDGPVQVTLADRYGATLATTLRKRRH